MTDDTTTETVTESQPGQGHTPTTFCHKPGTPAQKTLTTDDDGFLQGHLTHGDSLGECTTTEPEPTPTPTPTPEPEPTPTPNPTPEPTPEPTPLPEPYFKSEHEPDCNQQLMAHVQYSSPTADGPWTATGAVLIEPMSPDEYHLHCDPTPTWPVTPTEPTPTETPTIGEPQGPQSHGEATVTVPVSQPDTLAATGRPDSNFDPTIGLLIVGILIAAGASLLAWDHIRRNRH